MEDIKKAESTQTSKTLEELKSKYGGKLYRVNVTIDVDDENGVEKEYYFKKPSTGAYDRYVKTTSNGATKALKTFLFDSVTEESRTQLEGDLEEFPALTLSLGEKLLGMMGLSKQTNLKML